MWPNFEDIKSVLPDIEDATVPKARICDDSSIVEESVRLKSNAGHEKRDEAPLETPSEAQPKASKPTESSRKSSGLEILTTNSYIDQFIQQKEERKRENDRISQLVKKLEDDFEAALNKNGSLEEEVRKLKSRLHQQQYTIVNMRQQYEKVLEDQEQDMKAEHKLALQDSEARFEQLDAICRRQQEYIASVEKRLKEAQEESTHATKCGDSVFTACSSISFEEIKKTPESSAGEKSWWSSIFK